MKQFNIYKSMMKYLTDKNLSLNAKGLLSIVLFQDEIIGTEIENYIENVNTEYRNIKELSSSLNSLSQIIKEDKETIKIKTENNKSLELRVKNLTVKTETQKE